ncbi:hypothetical protein PJWF_00104 [Achromobacter phage JWF]|uniref:hypothetical protein n=1 Tax=Achromobacter phage JWF TaxID=1589748 RepID=UPI000588E169|nr:hypothetical protein AXJ13_gp084 [Achromobacter phage JWF]AJD82997.1 hypothetical protein PJWF_00104 [Achromobacter phage JWF]
MASIQSVELRKTHRYVGTFKHLDEHEYLGVAKVLRGRNIHRPDSYYDEPSHGPVRLFSVIVPRGADRKKWQEALMHTFSAWGCAHEYDCCGCASYSASVRFVSKRRAVVHQAITYNF